MIVHNVTVIDARQTVEDSWIRMADGLIQAHGEGRGWEAAVALGDAVVDGRGGYVTPGFIDIHFCGGGGYSTAEGRFAILSGLLAHHAHGTTRALIGFAPKPLRRLLDDVSVVAGLAQTSQPILGSHLQDPVFWGIGAPDQRPGSAMRVELQQLICEARGTLRKVTINAALPGASEAVDAFRAAGIHVVVYFDGLDSAVQHLGSSNTVRDEPELEFILDGSVVQDPGASTFFDMAHGRIALVSGPMPSSTRSKVNEASFPELNPSAGDAPLESTVTLDHALRIGIENGLPPRVLVDAVTLTPARMMNISDKLGYIRPSYEADVVLFDQSWNIQLTVAQGRVMHQEGMWSKSTIPSPALLSLGRVPL